MIARNSATPPAASVDAKASARGDKYEVKKVRRICAERCTAIYHVSPDERWLAGRGATVRDLHVWDVASGESVAHIEDLGGNSNSRDVAVFSPDNRLLAFGTEKWEVKLWDIAQRQFVRTLGPHPWRVYAVSFSRDGRYVASSSWEGDVRISEVADQCGLSSSYFSRAFKRESGLPPHRWLMKRRVERARELLRKSDLHLAEIAQICGFVDQSHFARVFSKIEGCSPACWRRFHRC